MLLIIFLIFVTNCNKINNLDNKYKFELTDPQKEKIREGNLEALKSFLEHYGNDKNECSSDQESPILYIIKHFNSCHSWKKEETEKIILESIRPYIHKSDCIQYDKDGNTPLHYCLQKDYFEIAKALLDKRRKLGIDIQSIRNEEKDNPLYLAIEQENYKFINLFLENMNDINRPFKYILTPLIFAVLLGNDDIVNLLIEKGAVVKDVTDLRMITASNLGKELKEKLAERYIKSLSLEDFESVLWIFKTSRSNNFNLTIDHINKEINPKKAFRHYWDQELETKKEKIKVIFDKYNKKEIRIKKMLEEARLRREEQKHQEGKKKSKREKFLRYLKIKN